MSAPEPPPSAPAPGPVTGAVALPVRVFVYGTLLAGESNHALLATARLIAAARTAPAFSLHDLGSFPGLVVAGDDGGVVTGEVYEVDAPTLVALDHLEDHPRFYQRQVITLDGGLQAWTYLLGAEQVSGSPRIASGDWRSYWRAQQARPPQR